MGLADESRISRPEKLPALLPVMMESLSEALRVSTNAEAFSYAFCQLPSLTTVHRQQISNVFRRVRTSPRAKYSFSIVRRDRSLSSAKEDSGKKPEIGLHGHSRVRSWI